MAQISLLTPTLVCESGDVTCFSIDAPWRGVIRTLRIAQVGGVAAAAVVNIFQAELACTSSGSSSDGLEEVQVPELFQVCPTQNVSAGVPAMTFDVEWFYQNKDGDPPGAPVKKLYVSIDPGGSSDTGWVLAMEIETG